ncbi:hypothetical protein ONZ45_g12832 [Pleurotus djamor]|nr:hypothetical protein ONZ45_g12832 [Pleurotus djamor]
MENRIVASTRREYACPSPLPCHPHPSLFCLRCFLRPARLAARFALQLSHVVHVQHEPRPPTPRISSLHAINTHDARPSNIPNLPLPRIHPPPPASLKEMIESWRWMKIDFGSLLDLLRSLPHPLDPEPYTNALDDRLYARPIYPST